MSDIFDEELIILGVKVSYVLKTYGSISKYQACNSRGWVRVLHQNAPREK